MILSYEPVLRQESKFIPPVNVSSKPSLNMFISVYKYVGQIYGAFGYFKHISVSKEMEQTPSFALGLVCVCD